MKGKSAVSGFMLISMFKFVLGAIVVILLLTAAWNLLSPKKAEASTLKGMDDIIVKLGKIEENQPVIAYGYVDKGAAIVSFNSEQLKAGDFARPKQCGSRSNSCICAFKGRDRVLECKGYPSEKVSEIAMGSSALKIEGGAAGKSFTLEFLLSGSKLSARELT